MRPSWIPVLVGFAAGVLFVFCTTEGRDASRDAGPFGDALAAPDGEGGGACCDVEPYTFTTLAEGMLSTATPLSDPIAVGDYREVMVYLPETSCGPQPAVVEFRSDSVGPFSPTGQVVPGRIRVDGAELRLRYDCGFNISSFRVVGVR